MEYSKEDLMEAKKAFGQLSGLCRTKSTEALQAVLTELK